MNIVATEIPDVKVLTPLRHGDARGFFAEIFRDDALRAAGIAVDFVQENQAWSRKAGVVRGLHFQMPPTAQAKLVRASRGAILDVAVDIRHGSPTYGRHVAVELAAENGRQLFVPEGFAHGYRTLVADAEVIYKVNRYYAPADDRGLRWNDPVLGIDWRIDEADAILSDKDRRQPLLVELSSPFTYR